MPLWNRPCGFEEIRTLLREGRAEIGRKAASDAIQFAEAASSIGIDRGITGFVRYNLLKRRGDSYVALPAGTFSVQDRRETDLLQELNPLLANLDRFKSKAGQTVPQGFLEYRRAIDTAVFDLLVHESGAVWMKRVLAAVGRMERYFAARDPQREPRLTRPLSGLTPRWLQEADDGTIEFRAAAALASIRATEKVGPLRANLAPIDPLAIWKWANGNGQRAWAGNNLCSRLAGLLRRRIMDAERLGCETNPLRAEFQLTVDDVSAFIHGSVDEDMVEALLFGMGLIEWKHSSMAAARGDIATAWRIPSRSAIVPRSWALLKHLFLPDELEASGGTRVVVRAEGAIVPLLCAGRIEEACSIAARRCRVSGLGLPNIPFERDGDGTRMAAALLLPVRQGDLRRYLVLEKENHV